MFRIFQIVSQFPDLKTRFNYSKVSQFPDYFAVFKRFLSFARISQFPVSLLDEMIDNDTELIALNSNDNDIFNLIFLRRNHKDHVPRIREYYTKRLFQGTLTFTSTFSFDIIFVMSRPTVQQLCLLLSNWPQVLSEFNCIDCQLELEDKSPLSEKVSFCVLRSLK